MIYLDKYMNDILAKIYTNQNLCKYLLYDSSDPLSLPDIVNTKILYDDKSNQRILDTPFNMAIVNTEYTTLTINVNDASIDRSSPYYKDIEIEFFIICTYRNWNLSAGMGESILRPNGIVHELSNLFSQQRTVGLGKNNIVKLSKIYPNQVVGGYRMCVNATDFILST